MSETESAETPRAPIHNIKRLKPKQRGGVGNRSDRHGQGIEAAVNRSEYFGR